MHIELRKHFFSHKIHAAVNGSISRGEKRKKSPKVDNRESYYDTPKKVQIMTAAELEENNKEEETKEQPKKSLKERLKEQWQLMMKILQLVTNLKHFKLPLFTFFIISGHLCTVYGLRVRSRQDDGSRQDAHAPHRPDVHRIHRLHVD